MQLCEYGCGQEAKYQFKNGKWCCSKSFNSCSAKRDKHSIYMKDIRKDPNSKFNLDSYREKRRNIMKKTHKDPNSGLNSDLCKKKKSIKMKELHKDPDSKFNSVFCREKRRKAAKHTIKQIREKYPFFSKIEEMRYNNKKEIQVHCINHECENSKEKGGWFTPSSTQFKERKYCLENEDFDGSYFYCSQYCKDTCSLFNVHGDPYKDNNLPYTPDEYQTFRTFVLERDNYKCQFCGELATDVHHERPQKLEPFYALDPDYTWSCCKKCHYEKGHQGECSTGNLAKIVCSVESQKFLN